MKIACWIGPGVDLLEASTLAECLSGLPRARFAFVAETRDPVVSNAGLPLGVDKTLSELPEPELLLVTAGKAPPSPAVLHWLRTAHEAAAHSVAVGAGVALFEAAGLAPPRARSAPASSRSRSREVIRQTPWIVGPGASQVLDLVLHVVDELWGPRLAKLVQLSLEYAPVPDTAQASALRLRGT